MVGFFKAIFAAQHKLLSSIVLAFLTLALAFAGAVGVPEAAYAGTMTNAGYVGWIGGSGGTNTSNPSCPVGSVITTIKSYTYNNPNPGLGFNCSAINADGTLGAVTLTWGSGSKIYSCPAGMAAVGLYAFGAPNDVGITCKTPPNQYDAAQRVGPTGTPSQDRVCASNGFVNRLSVNTGAWFDGYQVGCVTLAGYPSAAELVTNDVPTGNTDVGATLTSATTIAGSPTPTLTYSWERSLSPSGPWSAVSGANSSTYVQTVSDAGYYFHLVVTGSNLSLIHI